MKLSRRVLSLSGLGTFLAGAVLVACTGDRAPLTPRDPVEPAAHPTALFALRCEMTLQRPTLSCGQPTSDGGARKLIVGGQNVHLTLTAANFSSVDVGDPTALDTLTMDVTLRNLIPQALGVRPDGTADVENGVRVFFHTGPTAHPTGVAAVADEDGTGLFLGSTQPFYRYPPVIRPNETSAPRRWKLAHAQGATSVRFSVYVDAEVQYPNGWVQITPGADTLAIGATSALSGTVRDVVGRPATVGQTLTWSSDDTSVATVDASTGLVTAVAQGTARITATNGALRSEVPILVLGEPTTVVVTGPDTMAAPGLTYQLTAQVLDSRGAMVPSPPVVWASTSPGTATISAAGVVTTHAPGPVAFRATAGALSADLVREIAPRVPTSFSILYAPAALPSYSTRSIQLAPRDVHGVIPPYPGTGYSTYFTVSGAGLGALDVRFDGTHARVSALGPTTGGTVSVMLNATSQQQTVSLGGGAVPTDIVVLLEGSGSLSDAGWQANRERIASALDSIEISPTHSRIAVVQYSTTVSFSPPFGMRFQTSRDAAVTAIRSLVQMDHSKNILAAVDAAQQYLLAEGRPGVAKTILLMGNAEWTNPDVGRAPEEDPTAKIDEINARSGWRLAYVGKAQLRRTEKLALQRWPKEAGFPFTAHNVDTESIWPPLTGYMVRSADDPWRP